jgi:hypothetical protein
VLEFAKKDYCKAVIFNCPSSNFMLEKFYTRKNGFKEIGKIFKKEL